MKALYNVIGGNKRKMLLTAQIFPFAIAIYLLDSYFRQIAK